MDEPPPDDPISSGDDRPEGIRYDPDLAVHEPAAPAGEPAPPSRRRSPLLLVPIAIAALGLLVYALFGMLASESRRSRDYVDALRLTRRADWQAAYELSRVIPAEDPAARDERVVPDVLALFASARDDDPRVREFIALALGELRDPRAVDALVSALQDSDAQTRIYAAWGLGAIGDRRGADGLLPLLDDPDPGLRKVAAYSLGALAPAGAADRLRPLLNDPVEDVAWNAALALARLGDPAAAPLLARMLDRRSLAAVRRSDEEGRMRPLDDLQQEEILINALRAAALLGDAAPTGAVEALRDHDPSLRVRQAAFESLAALRRGKRY